jgi:hypothetical protein
MLLRIALISCRVTARAVLPRTPNQDGIAWPSRRFPAAATSPAAAAGGCFLVFIGPVNRVAGLPSSPTGPQSTGTSCRRPATITLGRSSRCRYLSNVSTCFSMKIWSHGSKRSPTASRRACPTSWAASWPVIRGYHQRLIPLLIESGSFGKKLAPSGRTARTSFAGQETMDGDVFVLGV